jgi:hypothetical protein
MKELKIQKILLGFFFSASACGWLWSVYTLFKHWDTYQATQMTSASASAIFFARWVLVIFGLLVIIYFLKYFRLNRFTQFRHFSLDWFVIRVALYCILPPIFITTFLNLESVNILNDNRFLMRSIFTSILFFCLISWSLWAFLRLQHIPLKHSKNIWRKASDIFCMNIFILLFFGEVSLIIFNKLNPSILFYSESSDTFSRINSFRRKAGDQYFNFRLNGGGYHDKEFFRAEPPDLVIGLLADSFGFGVVPYDYNFATIAEVELQKRLEHSYTRIAIHNFGIPGIGMNEYASLLDSEVLQTNPSLVVLALFIGNDILESQEFGKKNPSRYCLQNWFIWLLPKNLLTLSREQKQQQLERQQLNVFDIGKLTEDGKIPGHIFDSSKEPPTFSVKKFLEIENWRFGVLNPRNENWSEGFESGLFKGLNYFHQRLGSRLVVVLIPDEFQVNDDLYEEITKSNPLYASFQPNYPQERILAYCKQHDIKCIDMLPALREGQKTGRTYHLRDTHLNAYGNRILGEELADALSAYLQKSVAPP